MGVRALRAADKSDDAYEGVRALSSTLKHSGVARKDRLGIINSFVEGTIHVRTAGASQFGLRYFDNVNAFEKGRYLFETFPASRKGLSLDPVWNQMSGLKQFQIREGATFFEGLAAPQKGLFNNLDFLSGGQTQFYVPDLGDLH
jgi:hypothetical protein